MEEEMLKAVKKDIQLVLKKAQRHINKGDTKKLKSLSDYTIHNVSIFQDGDSLSVAVIIYSLSKLIERLGSDSEHAGQARNLLGSAQFSLEQHKVQEYRDKMKSLFEFISTVDKESKIYIEKVIVKAQIKKGSRIYEHGISIARVAELLGVSRWELMSYIGHTRIHDEVEDVPDVEQRLLFARALFGVK